MLCIDMGVKSYFIQNSIVPFIVFKMKALIEKHTVAKVWETGQKQSFVSTQLCPPS